LVLAINLCIVIVVWGVVIPSASAEWLKEKFCLLRYDENCLQPNWIEGGAFAEILKQDMKEQCVNYLAKQTNLELTNTLNGLAKKIRIELSPKVAVKPFIIFEELRNALVVYRSKKLKKNIQIDENFQAKTDLKPNQITQLKKLNKRKFFSVSPYRNKIYGLHLQIVW
jgi:hypothetical protein